MSCAFFSTLKDPEADLDYRFDWEEWLDGDTIATSVWTIEASSGMSQHDASIVDGTDTIVWLSGGVRREWAYEVTNTITTAAGRTEERSLMVTIQNR